MEKNRNSLACLRNACSYLVESYCNDLRQNTVAGYKNTRCPARCRTGAGGKPAMKAISRILPDTKKAQSSEVVTSKTHEAARVSLFRRRVYAICRPDLRWAQTILSHLFGSTIIISWKERDVVGRRGHDCMVVGSHGVVPRPFRAGAR